MISLTTPATCHQLPGLAKGSRANSNFATNNPNTPTSHAAYIPHPQVSPFSIKTNCPP